MMTTRNVRILIVMSGAALSACAAPRPRTTPSPLPPPEAVPAIPVVLRAPVPEVNPALPAVPHVTGPLAINVIYPRAGATIASRDSNFIFGSVGNGDAGLTINGVLTPVWPNGAFMGWLQNPPASSPQYELVATTGRDTVRLVHPVKLTPPPADPAPGADTIVPISPAQYAALMGPATYPSDTDRVVTGYATTGGIQRWFLLPGTVVKVVGRRANDAFVQLDSLQTIRIEMSELRMLDSGTAPVPRTSLRASAVRLQNAPGWTDVVIPIRERPAFLVEQGPSSLTLILYDTQGRRQTTRPAAQSYLTTITTAPNGPQMRYTLDLRGPVFGYQPLWEDGKFTLRVRKPPAIDSAAPLRGITVAIDPGHPPVGATGPTGLWEPVPTLDVGLKTRELLQAKGVIVVMTRTTPDSVNLNLRPAIGRRANAHAFVSIHLNAVPDGVNPLRVHGTSTYHYHPHSQVLAESTQRAAVARMSLADKGVNRANFAVVRGTWMPSVLVEGAFIIVPDQEAAMRTPEYQERYAQAIVDGLENYFRTFALRR